MRKESRPVWHALREHATFWVIGGMLLAVTGFAPEEWLAHAVEGLHLPDNVLHLWAAGVDVRVVPIAIGVVVITIALIRQHHIFLLARSGGPPVVRVGSPGLPPTDAESMPQPVAQSLVPGTPEALPLPDKPSLAVLPFNNLSGDPNQEYFSDGMVEDIIAALSRASWLFVIARNSSFTYKGRAVDVKQVGHELGVRYVLEGSVRKAVGRVRITGQLIDAATGAHLWADHFDGSLEDVFDLQDRVTESVAGAIEPRLQRAEIERAKRKPTASLDAYDYFLRGMASLHQATNQSMRDAREQFGEALALDPAYGAAYGMAARCVVFLRLNQWLIEPEKEVAEGVRLARLAVTAGKDDPTALWTAGNALATLAGELDAGKTLIDRACALNPNLAAAWTAAGWVQIFLGEPLLAIEMFQRAMRLNPLDPLLHANLTGVAHAYFHAEQYDEARAWAERAINEQPNWLNAMRIKAAAYALSGRTEEAQHTIAQLLRLQPGMRLSNVQDWRAPYRRSLDTERFLQGLRTAGLPE